jgi:MYXO-CTERM domain-containing protein
VLVTFAPTADGPVTAELVLASNDPSQPEIVIPLAGNGATPDEGADELLGDAEDAKGSVNGCGCATDTGSPAGAAVALGAIALVWARRARSPRA